MPAPPSPLPARPSLEQLRKQAKDLLKQVRAGDDAAAARMRAVIPTAADPALGDAQFVLAREYGFDNWSALVDHVEAVNPQGLQRFETLARDVADAYTSADLEKLREINWTYGTSFQWEREPELMHRHLPRWFASETRTFELAVADAQQLVAAMCGFQDWAALVTSLSTSSAATRKASSAEARFYRIDPGSPTIGVSGPLSERHWDTVVSVIREKGLTGVWAPGASDAVIERLTSIEGLRRLYLGGGQITDQGLRHLSRLPALEELAIGGPRSPITDRGLDVLRRLPHLTRFWMTWAPGVSDAGIANLAGCGRLEIVDVMGTHTGDDVIAALAGKPMLRKVATGRLVTDAGAARFSEFPPFKAWHGGTIACDLGAFDSEPTHLLLDGPFDLGLAQLTNLDGLFGLNLFWHASALTPAAFEAVAALPRLGFLRVDREGAVTDEALRALSRSATIQSLACADTPHVTGRGFVALASMPSLHSLSLDCRGVDDQALAVLPRFPSLRTLWVRNLTDEGFRHVGRCTALESLAFPRGASDTATEHIVTLPHLKSLSAREARITDRSLAMIAAMQSLETLDVHGCVGVTDAGVSLLAALPKLSTLIVAECPHVTTAGLAALPAHVRVKRFSD